MIIIRELQAKDDLSLVLKLCKDFFAEYSGHHNDFFDTDNLTDADISTRFLNSLDSEESATYIAISDGNIVGYSFVSIKDQPNFYKFKKVGSISGLMVQKDQRNKGIATLLLKEATIFFSTRGVKYYTVFTAVVNDAAIKLYKRFGMKPLSSTLIGEIT